jgi:hypothetical protein
MDIRYGYTSNEPGIGVSMEGYPTVYWYKADRTPKLANVTDAWQDMDIQKLKVGRA